MWRRIVTVLSEAFHHRGDDDDDDDDDRRGPTIHRLPSFLISAPHHNNIKSALRSV